MLDESIEALRRATSDDLGAHFARGSLSDGTFEWRLERALTASSTADARDVLWDLDAVRPRARVDRVDIAGLGERLASPDVRATWTLGRSASNDVHLAHGGVSRRHARIAKRGHVWTVEDLGSSNGTYLNGHGVRRAQLFPDDVLDLGGRGEVVLHVAGWQPVWERWLDRLLTSS